MATSSWPGTVPTYTDKVDNTDVVYADHPNQLQADVRAIALNLGTNPHTSINVTSTDTFNPVSTAFASVSARIANAEKGVVGDSHTQYVKVSGGSVVRPTGTSTVNVTLRAQTSQTANLQEWRKADNTLGSYVDANGDIYGPNGALAVSSEVENLKALLFML